MSDQSLLPPIPDLSPLLEQTVLLDELHRRVKGSTSTLDFIRLLFRDVEGADLIEGEHHRKLADILDKFIALVEQGKNPNLMIFLPPRAGKTSLACAAMARFLGLHPNWDVITAAYNEDRAADMGRKIKRYIEHPHFQAMFPELKMNPASTSAVRTEFLNGGALTAAGVGTATTGRGARCVDGATMVTTEVGRMRIDTLVQLRTLPRVLAVDHATGVTRWCRIEAGVVSKRRITHEVRTAGGRTVRCTGEHKFFVRGRGYTEAENLRPGDPLVAIPCVPEVRRAEGQSEWDTVPQMLPGGAECRRGNRLRQLRKEGGKEGVRRAESKSSRTRRDVLLLRVFPRAPRGEEPEALHNLREPCREEAHAEMLRVPCGGAGRSESSAGTGVLVVPEVIPPTWEAGAVLLEGLRQRRALRADGRDGELPLQRREKLRQVVPGSVPDNFGPRRKPVRGLRKTHGDGFISAGMGRADKADAGDSPRQHGARGLSGRELGHSLRDVPRGAPPIRDDSVAVVLRVRGGSNRAYDIQVEGCRNFFAGEILAHNCIVVDDPVRDQTEADSEVRQEEVWKWWGSVINTRLAPEGGGKIVILTRWNLNDLAGRLLKAAKETPEADQWMVYSFPAILDVDSPTERSFFPERFTLEWLKQKRASLSSVDPRQWSAMYMQNPVPDSGIMFKIEHLKDCLYNPTDHPDPKTLTMILTCDLAVSEGSGDYSAIVPIGFDADDRAWVMPSIFHRRVDPKESIDAIKRALVEYPNISVFFTEKGPIWKALQSRVKEAFRAARTYPTIVEYARTTKKKEVATALMNACQSGLVRFPETPKWKEVFLPEMLAFPNGEHDDFVDALALPFAARDKILLPDKEVDIPREVETYDDVIRNSALRAMKREPDEDDTDPFPLFGYDYTRGSR